MKTLIIFFYIIFSSLSIHGGRISTVKVNTKTEEKLSMDYIDKLLKKYDIKFKNIVKAQIILETGWFKSEVCKENKNLFGMKYARQRETTAIGTNLKHAKYTTYEASIIDYKIWQNKYYKGGASEKTYMLFLKKKGYSENSKYISLLKKIRNKLSKT